MRVRAAPWTQRKFLKEPIYHLKKLEELPRLATILSLTRVEDDVLGSLTQTLAGKIAACLCIKK